jgi:branched-chain amino acid transport system permease protein
MTAVVTWNQIPNAVVSSVMLAGVYVIGGLAWVILFRAAKIFNFGTGQFIVLGAYLYYVLAGDLHLAVWISFPAAVALMGVVGWAVQMGLLRRLVGTTAHAAGHAPFAPVILTFGLAAVIQHAIAIAFGPGPKFLPNPFPARYVRLPGNTVLTVENGVVWALALSLFVSSLLFVRWSKWGIRMRAVAEQPLLASQSGIRVEWVYVGAWAAASAMAGVVGIASSFQSVVSPDLASIGIRSLAPVIVGGMDSIAGVLPGALIVAFVENLSALFFGEDVRDAAVMITVLVVLVVRPSGLFGTGDIRRP